MSLFRYINKNFISCLQDTLHVCVCNMADQPSAKNMTISVAFLAQESNLASHLWTDVL